MRRTLAPILAGAAALAGLLVVTLADASARAERAARPVLVELFTSQGCYSCPPADRLVGRLAAAGDVVALAFHVTYWDRLGWPDPFATDWGTQRQYAYGKTVSDGRVYTPQLVINGQAHVVGSDEWQVRRAIAAAAAMPHPATPALDWTASGRLRISLPDAVTAAGADIWLARFDKRRETAIQRGENGGRLLTYHQIVRERIDLARFDGRARTFETAVMPGADGNWGVVVIVQRPGPGQVLGAALLDAPSPDG